MNLHKLIFTECDSYKAGRKITPKGVMVHSTGANNPNLRRYVGPDDGLLGKNKYNNHWNMPKVGASVHAFIGKLKDGSVATYQVLPWDMRSGHCYMGKNGSGNDTHLSFEICEDGLKDAEYFKKVYQEAVELTAMLCKMYNLDPMADGVVIDHAEGYKRGIASNHGDVGHWFKKHGKSMDTFRADVKALLTKEDKPKEPAATSSVKKIYRIRKSWKDASSQRGAYLNLELAKKACREGYKVYDWNGKVVYAKETSSASTYSLTQFIKDVQKACAAKVDGIAGGETLSKTVTVSEKINCTHAVVKPLQKRLYALGYTQVGTPDGIAGPKFTKAVKAFQNAFNGIADGEITAGCKTWKKLLGMK